MNTWKVGKEKIKLPDGWHDVSYNDAMYIINNDLSRVKALSKISGKDLSKYKLEGNVQTLVNSYKFLNNLEMGDPELPSIIRFNGVVRSVPMGHFDNKDDFGNTTVGQIEDMAFKIQEFAKDIDGDLTNKDLFKIYPTLVAIYIQPLIDLSDYSFSKAMDMIDGIKEQIDFKTVCKMGAFFLKKSLDFANG